VETDNDNGTKPDKDRSSGRGFGRVTNSQRIEAAKQSVTESPEYQDAKQRAVNLGAGGQTAADQKARDHTDLKKKVDDFGGRLKDNSTPILDKGAVKGAGKSFLKKNAGKIAAGGTVAAVAVPILTFLFFMLLFKNAHIRTIFMDYEFAKFNRNFRQTLNEAIKEVEPKGNADTTIPDDADPVKQMEATNQAAIKDIQADTSGAKVEEAARLAENLDQSLQSTGGIIDKELGIDRGVTEPKPTDTDAQVREAADTEFREDVAGTEKAPEAPDAGGAKELEKQAKTAVDAGLGGEALDNKIGEFAGKANSVMAKLTGPFIIATYTCIIRDIYVESYKTFVKIKLASMGRLTMDVAKNASCQMQGDCSLAQAGAVADKFDNGEESFTQSCAYRRSAALAAGDCKQLDEKYMPDVTPSGTVGTLLHMANVFSNTKVAGVSTGNICSIVLSPVTQVGFVVTNVGTAVVGAITGVVDFGLSDVAVAGVEAAAQVFATKYGKALAITVASHYGNAMFKQKFSPVQMGNLMGAGSKVLSGSSCQNMGCPPQTPAQSLAMHRLINDERIAADRRKGLAYRLFSPKNPYSAMSLAADRVPATPKSALATLNRFATMLFNPSVLMHTGSGMVMGQFSTDAFADDSQPTYGIQDHGFTDQELGEWTFKENADYVNSQKPAYEAYAKKCFDKPMADLLDDKRAGKSGECFSTDHNDPKNATYRQFRLYRFRQRTTHDLGLLYNGQSGTANSGSSSAPVTAPTPSRAGSVYILGDSISLGLRSAGIITDFPTSWQPVKINSDTGRSIHGAGTDIAQSGLNAVTADSAAIRDAKTVIVILGTNPENNFEGAMEQLMKAIQGTGTTAHLYWVNLASSSDKPTGIGALYQVANANNTSIGRLQQTLGYTQLDWFHVVYPTGNPSAMTANMPSPLIAPDYIHPDTAGYASLKQLIISQVVPAGTK
jgi:hypothetical protein